MQIVHPKMREETNDKGMTPQELFMEEHKDMKKAGEEWMKNTATSCTVVGALIVTIMFAAAFTVPGGNDQMGVPIFLNEKNIYSLYSIRCSFTLFFINFGFDVYGNPHITTLCRRRIPQVLAKKDDNRPFNPFLLYCSHDDSLFCWSFACATRTFVDFPSSHLFG